MKTDDPRPTDTLPAGPTPVIPTLTLNLRLCEQLFAHARACLPEECCAVIFGAAGQPETLHLVPFENQQTRLHLEDPLRFPRDGRHAFYLDALALERRIEAEAALGNALVAIAHSHPGYPAYFSSTDRRAAAPFGFPSYERAWHLVVSVYPDGVREVKGFFWNDVQEDFLEGALVAVPALPGPLPGAQPFGEE